MTKEKLIQRYTHPECTNHWVVATRFVLLAVLGLAFFYPASFWLTSIFGTLQLARMIYPIIGVVMFLGFVHQLLCYWHHNFIDKGDVRWIALVLKVLKGYEMGDAGKYSGDQRDMFWLMTACMLVLIATGVVAWRPYFAQYFPIPVIRLTLLAHAWVATVLTVGITVHVYAAIWINGTTRAMVEGVVTQAWAKKHHPRWHREMVAKNKVHEENTSNGGIDGETEKP